MNDRSKLIILIEKLISVPSSQIEEDEVIEKIKLLSPDPNWSDYIFYSNEFRRVDGRIETERVVDKLLEYKSINL